ncbi:MAG: proline dehydrogenase [Phycisphaerae bacterium]
MIVGRTIPSENAGLDIRIQRIGTEILDRARSAEPSVLRPEWWLNRLLDWSTADPRRKVQLFRFIDVLPSLAESREVVRHLSEYLLREDVPLPGPFVRLLKSAADGAWYQRQLASITRRSALRMARRFIAGQTPAEALDTIHRLRQQRMAFTVDILGEATTSDVQADHYARQYHELMGSLAPTVSGWPEIDQIDCGPNGPLPRVNVSLKLSSLDPNFDPIAPERSSECVLRRLRPILREARRLGAFVNVDMEQYEYKDLTLAVFRQVLKEPEFRDFSDVGIVVQAYLADAPRDLEELISWVQRRGTPIAVRLVKGAYWDFETAWAVQQGWPIPVLTQKWQSDAQFESLARRLLDVRDLIRPALASHNVRSLAAALAYAESVGASRREYEIQMLYGMGDPLKAAIAEMGYTLRVYTPFGELIPGMAYLIRRLLENTSNQSFLKHSFADREAPERLLADPAVVRPASPPLPGTTVVDLEESDSMEPFAFEPTTDFARESSRRAMEDALQAARAAFGREYPLVIDGHPVQTQDLLDSLNPSNRVEIVGRVCMASLPYAESAVAAARKAFGGWSRRSARERAELLRGVADVLRQRRFEIAAWIILEVGKPWREADADVAEAIDFCEYYGQQAVRLEERPRRRDFPGEENIYAYAPRGVAVVIAPWNFPLAILTGMTTAALAAGNTVVMKPAEQSSIVAAHLMQAFTQAGLPPGVVNFLPGNGEEVGARLVEHPDVDIVAFTGSRQVGVWIYEHAARWQPGQRALKRVIAEMGGKNAIIVDADVDLDEAVEGVLASAFGYAGQKCSACSRVIVLRRVHDAFVDRLVEAGRSVPVGPAENPETIVGPVVDASSQQKVLSYIEKGKQEARLVWSADLGDLPARGFFVPPTIFADVPPDACIAQEEIFGPVLAITAVESFEEAIQVANGTEYGLTGGIYSRSPAHIEQAKRELHVGNLYVNRKITGALVDRQPFGGVRMSGVGGKAGGPDYVVQFMEPKTITENTLRHGLTPTAVGA